MSGPLLHFVQNISFPSYCRCAFLLILLDTAHNSLPIVNKKCISGSKGELKIRSGGKNLKTYRLIIFYLIFLSNSLLKKNVLDFLSLNENESDLLSNKHYLSKNGNRA